jgi:hypothetical protein
MNPMSPNDWQPEPQLLAAYFDGELDGSDDTRARIEAWLEAHPEAGEESAELKKLLRDTAPVEPSDAAWKQTLERVNGAWKRPVAAPRVRRPWLAAAVVAASIVLFIGILFGAARVFQMNNNVLVKTPQPKLPDDDDFEVLQVASMSEVTILRIDGADTDAMIVGELPVCGPLDLADSGEVRISCKCPRVGYCQDAPNRPMVWALASAD